MAKKQKTANSTNSTTASDVSKQNIVGETKEITKVDIPVEELIAYIVAKIDYLTDVIESCLPKKETLKI